MTAGPVGAGREQVNVSFGHHVGVRQITSVIIGLVLAAGCASSDSDRAPAERVQGKNSLSVAVPDGWTVGTGDPRRLSVYDGDMFIHESCDSPRDLTHVGVRFDVLPPSLGIPTFGKRPERFTSSSGSGVSRGFADQPCGSSSQQIRFSEKGRLIDTYVDFGSKASERAKRDAYEILNSLHVSASGG